MFGQTVRKIFTKHSISSAKPKRLSWTKRLIVLTGGSSLAMALSIEEIKEKSNFTENLSAGVRFLRSLKIGVVISCDYYVSMLGLNESSPNYPVMMSMVHQRSAEKILQGCLVNGGTYIKIGQGLVCLSHLLPKEYITTLTQLQDKCLVRENDEVDKLFLEDFGKTPKEIYKEFDDEPIAAASLAQVYKAVTKDNEKVAVKVQYIDLNRRFVSDVATIQFLCRMAALLHPNFNFSWILDDVTSNLKEELNFISEGKNSERCASDLKHLSFVHVPKVFWNLCSTRVLVTEFVDAIKINEKKDLVENGFSLADVDTKLFKAFGEQIFQTGFVHADPHPGNVLVRKHNNNTQLVLLDHGLYQEINQDERSALSQFWKALVLKNHKEMQKQSLLLGVKDYTMLAEILTQRPLRTGNFKLISKLSEDEIKAMQAFAQKRFDIVLDTLKSMPNRLLLVVRNLNTIRAIAHDHGDPIDRYTLLARAATKTAFRTDDSIAKKVFYVPTRLYFEFQLLRNWVSVWFIETYLNILHLLGRAPTVAVIKSNLR